MHWTEEFFDEYYLKSNDSLTDDFPGNNYSHNAPMQIFILHKPKGKD